MTKEPRAFSAEVHDPQGRQVVVLRGDLDLASAPELERLCERVPGDALLLDLRALEFLDSSGLAVLLREAAERRVILEHPNELVLRILETTGVLDRFEVRR